MQGDGKKLKTTEFVMNKQASRKASPKRRKREKPERDELDFSELKPKKTSSRRKKKRKFRLRTFFIVLVAVIVVVAVGFGIFVSGYYRGRNATGVVDPLYITAVAFSDEETTAVVICKRT